MRNLRHFGVWLVTASAGLLALFSVIPDGPGWSVHGVVMSAVGGYAASAIGSNLADLLVPLPPQKE